MEKTKKEVARRSDSLWGQGKETVQAAGEAFSSGHAEVGACSSAVGLQLRKNVCDHNIWDSYATLMLGFLKTVCALKSRAEASEGQARVRVMDLPLIHYQSLDFPTGITFHIMTVARIKQCVKQKAWYLAQKGNIIIVHYYDLSKMLKANQTHFIKVFLLREKSTYLSFQLFDNFVCLYCDSSRF